MYVLLPTFTTSRKCQQQLPRSFYLFLQCFEAFQTFTSPVSFHPQYLEPEIRGPHSLSIMFPSEISDDFEWMGSARFSGK